MNSDTMRARSQCRRARPLDRKTVGNTGGPGRCATA